MSKSQLPSEIQLSQAAHFNWRCAICGILAHSPLELELKEIAQHGPHFDIDFKLWIKCSVCQNPYHVHCLKITPPPVGPYKCHFNECHHH